MWIETHWTDHFISLRILDDGQGFPPHLLGRIGDPFVKKRKSRDDGQQRPEYEGMGLGLFIAKTLLVRSGAELAFDNGSDPYRSGGDRESGVGAIVEVIWERDAIDARTGSNSVPLGKNKPIVV